MKRIEQLSVDLLTPGMVLAEPVIDARGTYLMAAGIELSEIAIARLSRCRIGSVFIVREWEEDPAETEAYRTRLVEQLDSLFRQAGEGDETRALYRVILDYRMEHRL